VERGTLKTGFKSPPAEEGIGPAAVFATFLIDFGKPEGDQPFTYDLFDALRPSEFERRGSWFAESSEPPNTAGHTE
jgi:hypothetical protein